MKARKTIFWTLEGDSHLEKHNSQILEFISSVDLIQKLQSLQITSKNSSNISELLIRIQWLKKTRLRNPSEFVIVNKNKNLNEFL